MVRLEERSSDQVIWRGVSKLGGAEIGGFELGNWKKTHKTEDFSKSMEASEAERAFDRKESISKRAIAGGAREEERDSAARSRCQGKRGLQERKGWDERLLLGTRNADKRKLGAWEELGSRQASHHTLKNHNATERKRPFPKKNR